MKHVTTSTTICDLVVAVVFHLVARIKILCTVNVKHCILTHTTVMMILIDFFFFDLLACGNHVCYEHFVFESK